MPPTHSSSRGLGNAAALAALALLACLAFAAVADAARFGVATSATRQQFHDAPSPREMARLGARAGARIERIGISWEAVQPRGDRHGGARYSRWTRYDRAISAMRRRDIKPLIMIADAPAWAHRNLTCNWDHCPPDPAHYPAWAKFAAAVANRYPAAVGIEIWNSPNTWAWWPVAGGPDPQRYATVYQWAANAIHRADPNVHVLFGAVGYASGDSQSGARGSMGIPSFLSGFYRNVERSTILRRDGMSVHAYPSATEVDGLDGRFRRTMEQVRDVRSQYDRRRKIWVTETGISTTGDAAVSYDQQKRVLVNVVETLERRSAIAATIVYTLVEGKWSPNVPHEMGYGIVRRGVDDNLVPKPAFCAFARRAGTPPSRSGCQGGGATRPRYCTIRGTPRDDFIRGTRQRDVICSGGGGDQVRGRGGDDTIMGGPGGDRLVGGRGNDYLRGGRGNDVLVGGADYDWLVGGPGRDYKQN